MIAYTNEKKKGIETGALKLSPVPQYGRGGLYISGKPKGNLSILGYKGNSTDVGTNMGLLYGHKEFKASCTPTISVSADGLPSFSGLTAGLSYDEIVTRMFLQYN